MPRILEAEAVIRARDATGGTFAGVASKIGRISESARRLSAISSSLSSVGTRVGEIGNKVSATGRKMSMAVTVPTAIAAKAAWTNIHEFELASNKLKAFGDLNAEQLKRTRDLAKQVGSDYAFGPVGTIKGMVEQLKAGFEPRHLKAIQQPILDFATMTEIDVPQASELAIFSLAGFGRMYDKTGKMLEDSDLNKNLREMVDLFAVLNKVAPGNIKQISETFKYSAPIANSLKVAPEQLGAFTAALAQAGIIGPESGVALRSMLVRFLKTPRPALAALSAAGMTMDDYVQRNPALLKPASMLSAIEQQTGTLDGKKRGALLGRLEKLGGLDGEAFEKGLIAAIQSTGSGDLKDSDVAGKLATRIIGTALEKIDIMKFLRDVFTKTANPAAFMSLFMDQRQGARLANLDFARVAYMLSQMQEEMDAARKSGTPISRRMASTVNSGVIESENRLRGAYQNLFVTLGETGLTDAATNTFNALSSGLRSIADFNPRLLEFATYATAAAAAAGPVVWVTGKIASLIGMMSQAGAFGAAAASNPAVLGAAAVAGGGYTIYDILKNPDKNRDIRADWLFTAEENKKRFMGYGLPTSMSGGEHEQRERIKAALIAGDPTLQGYAPSFIRNRRMSGAFSVDEVAQAMGGSALEAKLTGNAEITVKVVNEPTPDFWTRIQTIVSNSINAVRVNGAPPTGTAGSTGSSMPEAGPTP